MRRFKITYCEEIFHEYIFEAESEAQAYELADDVENGLYLKEKCSSFEFIDCEELNEN